MIELQEVKTGKQRKEFVDFPIKLYRDDPNYMPGVFSDSLATITPEKNKAFNFCEARFWLAKRDGETVGRIGAIINHRANEKWDKNQMRFWNVDFIDDAEVSACLLGAVEEWAREKGCTEIVGPMGFTDLDLEGMLVDGFDERGIFALNFRQMIDGKPTYVNLKATRMVDATDSHIVVGISNIDAQMRREQEHVLRHLFGMSVVFS